MKVNEWWSSLTVREKERIASKIKGEKVYYPECTEVWNKATIETKTEIFNHCNIKHHLTLKSWKDGKPYGD